MKVFGCNGPTNEVIDAIEWAVDNNMDVINMSLGSPFGSPDAPDAVAAENAAHDGVIVVASSGNEGSNAVHDRRSRLRQRRDQRRGERSDARRFAGARS